MNNEGILKSLETAMKSIVDVSQIGQSILSATQFDRFVRAMQRRTNVLQEARFIPMDSQKVNIDRIGFAGRVITKAITAAGASKGSESEVAPAFDTNSLQAAEFRAKTGIEDRALRRNIERGGLEGTLVDLFGEAAGRDWEEIALLGEAASVDIPDTLQATSGWLEKAATKISDVDPTASDWPINLFEAALLAMPKQFWVNPSEFRFYVPWEVRNAYIDLMIERKTPLGDRALTDAFGMTYKGIPVVATAMLERSEKYDYATLLSHPDNMVWGVFHEITIEPDREPGNRRTNFYLTVEADAHYEDENAAVAVRIAGDS